MRGSLRGGTAIMAEVSESQTPVFASEKPQVSIGELALFFLRLGTTAFGGPAHHRRCFRTAIATLIALPAE
jgi:hypothetical protein